jgi:alkyl hydroperoxide reductase subunit D
MTIDDIKNKIGDFAKDIRLNFTTVLKEEKLTENQRYGILLASAYATKSNELIQDVEALVADKLSDEEQTAIKAAVAIMAMNNIYYRYLHLVSDKDYIKMPAGLRMNVMANPGIEKSDFELYSLAVSAINGCGMCMDTHEKTLRKHNLSAEQIQQAVKIAAITQALAQSYAM